MRDKYRRGGRRSRGWGLAAVLLVSLLLCGPVPAPSARAQEVEGFDLTVSPVKKEFTLQPGEGLDFAVTLINHAEHDQELLVYAMDFTVDQYGNYEFHEPGQISYSCSRWIEIPRERLVIPARTQHEEPFRLQAPPDAEPGGHFSVLFFQDASEPPPGQGVKPSYRIGSLILVTIPGEIVRDAEIRSFSVGSDFFSLWGPPEEGEVKWPARDIPYRVEVENTGNVHLTLRLLILYRPSVGFGSGSVDLGEITILPGTVRVLEGHLPKPPFLGFFRAEAVVSYGPDMYTFDTEKRAGKRFVVFPVLWFLFLVLVGTGVWYLARFLRGRFQVSLRVSRRR